MASAGVVTFVIRGNWVSGTTNYRIFNLTYYGGSTYIAKNDISSSTINPETDTTNWQLFAHGYVTVTLSGVNGIDASGLLGEIGAIVTGQALIDKIADKVSTELLPIENIKNNTTTSIAGFALDARQANPNETGSLAEQITQTNSNLDIVRTFKNKKILILGDSISDEALTENLAPNWVAHLRTKLNGIVTSITNNSHSGRKMIELPDIVNSYSSLDQDIVIIFLGTNDWDADIPLGNYGADYATKYSDAIKKTFENINSKYSTRKPLIYFITPLWRNNAEGNSLTYNVDFYRKPIIGFCKRYGTRWINGEGFPYMSDYYKLNNDIFFDDVHPNPWFSEYMCTHIINRIMADGDCDFNNGSLVKNMTPFYSPGNIGTVYAYFCNNDLHIKGSFARNPTSGETLFTVLGANPELIADVFGTMFYPVVYSYSSGGTAISGTGLLFTNNDGTMQIVTNSPLTTESTNFKFDITIKPMWCNILKEL